MKKLTLATLLALGACVERAELPESTTTLVGPEGGTALSADGLMRLEIPRGALSRSTEIRIATRKRDLDFPGQLTRAYEVIVDQIVLGAEVQLTLQTTGARTPNGRFSLQNIDGAAAIELSDFAVIHADAEVRSVVHGLSRAVYALFDAPVIDPCAGRVCGTACVTCDPHDPVCTAVTPPGVCDDYGACRPATAQTQCSIGPPIDGWDDPPGTGIVFVVDSFAFAPAGEGYDLDGRCTEAGVCIDNLLGPLGDLMNDQIRQALLGGEALMLIEVAGIQQPFTGDDDSVTVKLYTALDFDDPFFPANNFRIPPGETTCCEYLIRPMSIAGAPVQARSRSFATIRNNVVSTLAPIPFQGGVWLPFGEPPTPELRFEHGLLRFTVNPSLTRIERGLFGAAMPINSLARYENPYCRTTNVVCERGPTMVSVALTYGQPDLDLDVPPDGLEHLEVDSTTHEVLACTDGDGSIVPPVEAGKPWTCALRPQLADAFTAAFRLSGVRATVRGVAPN